MNTYIVYATSNPGKIIEIGRHFAHYGLAVRQLSDFLPLKLDPEETGTSLGENSRIKALAYAGALSRASSLRGVRFIVVSDDTGFFITGLGGEPGIKVRRWIGRRMTDEEIIDHTMERMKGLSGEGRAVTSRSVLTIVTVDEKGAVGAPEEFEGSLEGRIIDRPLDLRIEGFPFESMYFVTEYGMMLGDLHRLPDAEKFGQKRFNHRERAIEEAIPHIRKLMGNKP